MDSSIVELGTTGAVFSRSNRGWSIDGKTDVDAESLRIIKAALEAFRQHEMTSFVLSTVLSLQHFLSPLPLGQRVRIARR